MSLLEPSLSCESEFQNINLQKMEIEAMEDTELVDNDQEQYHESFVCCVCLDLLYKPLVLSCGHISCFWCVQRSMNDLRESHCPICRQPYYHFPTICQMLHFLLLKMYPVSYKIREGQTLEEEKKKEIYSTQFVADSCGLQAKYDHPGSSSSCPIQSFAPTEQSRSATHKQDESTICSKHNCDASTKVIGTPVEQKLPKIEHHHGQQMISVADVMCTACKQLLFRPVVLNCGHVYCETCVINTTDKMLKCQLCQSPHPRGFPKVCLGLDCFLEQQFPEEYAQQRDAIQLGQVKVKPETPSSCSLDDGKKGEKTAFWSDPRSKVHIGVGCDFCGMYPIVGDRFRCKDCKEKIGFDLCGDCYNTSSKLPGRFNQQHTSEHMFELVRVRSVRNIMLRLITGHFEESSINGESWENLTFNPEDPSSDGEDNQNGSETPN